MLTFLDGIQKGTVTMQFDEEGNLTMEESESDMSKKDSSEEKAASVGEVSEREDLENEE